MSYEANYVTETGESLHVSAYGEVAVLRIGKQSITLTGAEVRRVRAMLWPCVGVALAGERALADSEAGEARWRLEFRRLQEMRKRLANLSTGALEAVAAGKSLAEVEQASSDPLTSAEVLKLAEDSFAPAATLTDSPSGYIGSGESDHGPSSLTDL